MIYQQWVAMMYSPWLTGTPSAYVTGHFPAPARKRSPARRRPIRSRIGWVMVQIGLRLAVGQAERGSVTPAVPRGPDAGEAGG